MIPAVYYAYKGNIDIPLLLGMAVIATLIGDSFWYVVGRNLPKERLSRWRLVKHNQVLIDKLSRFFSTYGLWLLFYSKFIYGVRLATQIIFGFNKCGYIAYLAVNTLGVLAWIGFVFAIAFMVSYSLESLKNIVFGTQIAFLVFVLLIIGINILIKRIAKRTLLKNEEEESDNESSPDQQTDD